MNKLLKNKKGVFGLNAIQSFFAIILGIALLAYVIVVIMGTLQTSTILPDSSLTVINETGYINGTGYTLSQLASYTNPRTTTVVYAYNKTSGLIISSANYTLTNNVLYNTTARAYNNVTFSYSFNYDSNAQINSKSILSNTSGGITSFFSSITPVYAILAILVIILVLVVLVRVVQAPGNRNESSSL